jgi:hypothetical protein
MATRTALEPAIDISEPEREIDRDGILRIEIDCGFRKYVRWFYDASELGAQLEAAVNRQGMPVGCAVRAFEAAARYCGSHVRFECERDEPARCELKEPPVVKLEPAWIATLRGVLFVGFIVAPWVVLVFASWLAWRVW